LSNKFSEIESSQILLKAVLKFFGAFAYDVLFSVVFEAVVPNQIHILDKLIRSGVAIVSQLFLNST